MNVRKPSEILKELKNNKSITLNRLNEIRLEVKQIIDNGFDVHQETTMVNIFLKSSARIIDFMLGWDDKKNQLTDKELDLLLLLLKEKEKEWAKLLAENILEFFGEKVGEKKNQLQDFSQLVLWKKLERETDKTNLLKEKVEKLQEIMKKMNSRFIIVVVLVIGIIYLLSFLQRKNKIKR